MFDLIDNGAMAQETLALAPNGVELIECYSDATDYVEWLILSPDNACHVTYDFQDASDTYQRWCDLY